MSRALVPMILAAALGACVADNGDEGIFILKNVAPGDECVFDANESSPFIAHGTWSVLSPSGYRFHPQMRSRITALAGEEDQRTVITRGARVNIEITDPTLAGQLDLARLQAEGVTRFESLFSAPIAPNGGITDAGFDLMTRRLIDEIAAVRPEIGTGEAVFRTELIATAVVYGDMSGSEVTSQEFRFPVTLCNDCVVNVVGTCPVTGSPRPGNPCNAFQDGVVDCCTSDGDVYCPAPVASTAR